MRKSPPTSDSPAASSPCGEERPTILFFYGNGETAADYDNIAPIYNQVGLNFFVADYRGYGQSGGSPSFCSMPGRRPSGAAIPARNAGPFRLLARRIRHGPLHGAATPLSNSPAARPTA